MTARVPSVSGPVTGGRGWAFGSPPDVSESGHVLEEFGLEGVASCYEPVPGTVAGRDGRWLVQPGEPSGYKTRMYVVRPADPADFNGVVVVNWLNVTAGFDLGAPSRHELRGGFAWVGVSAQAVSINGQPAFEPGMPDTKGLPAIDPARYGTLHHPGDRYSYDIFAQAARAVGPGRATAPADPLSGLSPHLVIASGASQSAARLGSYINLADDSDRVFDGFFLLVHWGLCPYPPDQPLMATFQPVGDGFYGGSCAINDRGRVPIFVLNSQSETLHNLPVRQPDSATFRFWEIAGATHTGDVPDLTAMFEREGMPPFPPVPDANTIDWTWVRDAALEHLVRWAGGGDPPPAFPPIDASAAGGIHVDEAGNATGGVRIPDLEVPTAAHSGTRPGNPLAALVGQTIPFGPAQIAARYRDAATYQRLWDAAVDRARDRGLVLDADLPLLRERGQVISSALWPGSAGPAH